jgi:enoyl-CoA hydratase
MHPPHVRTEIAGATGVITLDRPGALNALTLDMCVAIDAALSAWAADSAIGAVVIRSASPRAFCAGGDVRAVHDAGKAWKRGEGDDRLQREFFRTEYAMNRRIKTFPKPYVALIDGVAMGGGAGLSIHGSHVVATETTLFAMPETAIGLFPDVGASFALPRLPGETGVYLGLTGARIRAADLIALGLATHVAPSAGLGALSAALVDAIRPEGARAAIDAILGDQHKQFEVVGEAGIAPQRAVIDRCFGFDRVEAILDALDAEPGDFAAEAAATIRTMSPTSLKLTLLELRRGRSLTFDDCMRMEYRLSQSVLAGHDFYEGVRAQLVDKDRKPRWYPSTLDAVDERGLAACFLPPRDGDLTFVA